MTQNNAPFPGAQKNPMLLIGLQAKDVTGPNHFTLDAKQAVNFSSAKPVTLLGGNKLYRVYGGAASATGAYWSPSPPPPGSTIADWRSANAVLPSWNDGTHVDVLEIKHDKTLQFWTGGVESQPITDAQHDPMPGWFLVGGGTQFFTQSWIPAFADAVDVVEVGPTPWSNGATPTTYSADVPLAAAATDLDPGRATDAHVSAVLTLAGALRDAAGRLDSAQGDHATALGIAANNLAEAGNAMLANLGTHDDKVIESAKTQIGLARVVERTHDGPDAAHIDAALGQVVLSAAAFSGRAG